MNLKNLFITVALLFTTIACGSEDEPKPGDLVDATETIQEIINIESESYTCNHDIKCNEDLETQCQNKAQDCPGEDCSAVCVSLPVFTGQIETGCEIRCSDITF